MTIKKMPLELFPYKKYKQNGEFKGIANQIDNIKSMLNFYNVMVTYNVITKCEKITFNDKMLFDESRQDDNEDRSKLEIIKSLCSINEVPDQRIIEQLSSIAALNPFNPVVEYCTQKPWDGRDRILDVVNTVVCGDENMSYWKEIAISKFLYASIAASVNDFNKNYNFKSVLVFQGKQGVGKTPWIRLLTGELKDYVLQGHYINPEIKDTVIQAIQYWIVELGELDAITKKSDEARLKAFIDKPYDEMRLPYAAKNSKFPRRTVFFGSVNPKSFLTDNTGNSRYWCIPVDFIKLELLEKIDKQQLWAQIYEIIQPKLNEKPYIWQLNEIEKKCQEDINNNFVSLRPIEQAFIDAFDDTNDGVFWIAGVLDICNLLGWSSNKLSSKDKQCIQTMLENQFGEKTAYHGKRGWKIKKPNLWLEINMKHSGMKKQGDK